MDPNHQYFYQVQMQMHVLRANFCDFVVWTSKDCLVLRVNRDDTYLKMELLKAEDFFKMVIMPELLGQYYTGGRKD